MAKSSFKLAIVGSRVMTLAQAKEARDLIDRLIDEYMPNVVVSGGAFGVDKIAADCARRKGIEVDEKLPADLNWPAYRARNILIAETCDTCIAIKTPQSVTGGTSFTMQYARTVLKKPVRLITLKGPRREDPRVTDDFWSDVPKEVLSA